MNDKQLERADEELNAITRSGKKLTLLQKVRREELSCVRMINSILAYGGFGKTAFQILEDEHNRYYDYLAQYVEKLGEDRVIELIKGQINSVRRVDYAVFTDNEGVIYNSLVFED